VHSWPLHAPVAVADGSFIVAGETKATAFVTHPEEEFVGYMRIVTAAALHVWNIAIHARAGI
jgi:hypothetical protein